MKFNIYSFEEMGAAAAADFWYLKFDEGQGDYNDKRQKFFKTIIVWAIEYEFL